MGRVQGEERLANAAESGQDEHTRVVAPQQRGEFRDRVFTPDERDERPRQSARRWEEGGERNVRRQIRVGVGSGAAGGVTRAAVTGRRRRERRTLLLREPQGLGQQPDRVRARRLSCAAFQHANGVRTHAGLLGQGFLSEIGSQAILFQKGSEHGRLYGSHDVP